MRLVEKSDWSFARKRKRGGYEKETIYFLFLPGVFFFPLVLVFLDSIWDHRQSWALVASAEPPSQAVTLGRRHKEGNAWNAGSGAEHLEALVCDRYLTGMCLLSPSSLLLCRSKMKRIAVATRAGQGLLGVQV